MNNLVVLETVDVTTLETYIAVGKKSYREHYLHLWENEDPTPYISIGFTNTIVSAELMDSNVTNYLVKMGQDIVGIVKLVKNKGVDEFPDETSLKAEKIYLLKAFSGKGLGKKVLQLIEKEAIDLKKKVVWLDTMQKGKPLQFYLKNGFKIKRESELTILGAKPSEKAMYILTKQL